MCMLLYLCTFAENFQKVWKRWNLGHETQRRKTLFWIFYAPLICSVLRGNFLESVRLRIVNRLDSSLIQTHWIRTKQIMVALCAITTWWMKRGQIHFWYFVTNNDKASPPVIRFNYLFIWCYGFLASLTGDFCLFYCLVYCGFCSHKYILHNEEKWLRFIYFWFLRAYILVAQWRQQGWKTHFSVE